jgi:hypothetical protein
MKNIILLLVGLLMSISLWAKTIPGYFIDSLGNKVETEFKIRNRGTKQLPFFPIQSSEFKYTENGVVKKLKPGNCQKVVIDFFGTEYTFVSLTDSAVCKAMERESGIFAMPKISGEISLYKYDFLRYYYNGTNSSSSPVRGNILIKSNGEVFVRRFRDERKKQLIDFISDYEDLVTKIENKEIKTKDIEQIVEMYNLWHSQQ